MNKSTKFSSKQLLSKEGPIATSLAGFELRQEQEDMMENVMQAYRENEIVLIEAGTGTGKSLAYLIPALLFAVERGEKTIISTKTITLQEQLLHKDIPFLMKALGVQIKVTLAKGMSNYLCLRKMRELESSSSTLSEEERRNLDLLLSWEEHTCDGARQSIPHALPSSFWEQVAAESDTCSGKKCQYYNECHFFNARKQLDESQIIIVNHHLLFADLALKGADEEGIGKLLPDYSRVILDEAHHIEDIATEFFGTNVNKLAMLKSLSRLSAERGGKQQGAISLLVGKLQKQEHSKIAAKILLDAQALKRTCLEQMIEVFDSLEDIALASQKDEGMEQVTMRIFPTTLSSRLWKERAAPAAKALFSSVQKFRVFIIGIKEDLQSEEDERIKESCRDLLSYSDRLSRQAEDLHRLCTTLPDTHKVRWLQAQLMGARSNIELYDVDLDVAKSVAEKLFTPMNTVLLCSATLTANNSFIFLRKRLGLTATLLPLKEIREYLYPSPFDYKRQALFAIPSDLPEPTSEGFFQQSLDAILSGIEASRGNAFVLFTSYTHLKQCFNALSQGLQNRKYILLRQGEESRQALLNRFRQTDRAVLFGTDSFWEGVDVVGEALRLVIICKLPFQVPTEPIVEARAEAVRKEGGNPFLELTIPRAIVKFKQGAGRLIRHRNDRGCILCLDTRILTKSYGKFFVESLPPFERAVAPSEHLFENINAFYRRTWRPRNT